MGELAGLGAAYDRYAVSLYGYCHSLLIYSADAADTVHDTFVIAWTKVPCLQDPHRLRAWLFAIARHECHGRPSAGALSAPRTDTGEMTGFGHETDVGDAELRYLVRAALTGLEPAEREVLELNLRYQLEGADLADTLGVPRSQAQALATRARSRFTKLLGVLLAAWPARGRCAAAAGLLDGWDGTLTTVRCKRLASHIRRCSVCGESRHREVGPAMMLALLPAAVPPGRLWERVTDLVTDDSADAEDRRQRIARRAEPLAATGFPVQAARPPAPRLPARYVLAAGAAAAVALLGGGAFLVNYNSSHSVPSPASGAPVATGSVAPAGALKAVPPASSSPARSSPASYLTPASGTGSVPPTLAPTKTTATRPAPTKTATTRPAPTKTTATRPAPTKTATTRPAPTRTTATPTPPRTTPPPPPTPTATPTPTAPTPTGTGTGG